MTPPSPEQEATTKAAVRRLGGHALRSEGRPFLVGDCCGEPDLVGIRPNDYDRIGHGVCECGARSSCQDANDYRQAWHREHKQEILDGF